MLNIKWENLIWQRHSDGSYTLRGYLCDLYDNINIGTITEHLGTVKKKNDGRWEWTRHDFCIFKEIKRHKQGVCKELEEAKFKVIEDLYPHSFSQEEAFTLQIRRDPENYANYMFLKDWYEEQGDQDKVNWLKELIFWMPYTYTKSPCGEIPNQGIDKLINAGLKINGVCLGLPRESRIHPISRIPKFEFEQFYCIHRSDGANTQKLEVIKANNIWEGAKDLDFNITSNILLAMEFWTKCVGINNLWFKSGYIGPCIKNNS